MRNDTVSKNTATFRIYLLYQLGTACTDSCPTYHRVGIKPKLAIFPENAKTEGFKENSGPRKKLI